MSVTCRLSDIAELKSTGLSITDLNMYDSSRDMVMAGWQHASKLELSIEKVVNFSSYKEFVRCNSHLPINTIILFLVFKMISNFF